MRDFADDLRRWLNHEPIQARPAGVIRRVEKWVRRHPTVSTSLMLAVSALVAISFLLRQTLQAKRAADSNAALARASAIDADVERSKADRRASEVLRLADARKLRDLETRAHALWPAHPSKIPELERWLTEATALTQNLPVHESALRQLREQPVERGGLGFSADEQAWWAETLGQLVTDLRRFAQTDPNAGTIASVRARLESARTISQRSIGDHDQEWETAINEIALSDRYGGLEIKAQMGLVPLGADPATGLQEFWHVESGARPERDSGSTGFHMTGESGVVLVLLPGATFTMGAQRDRPEGANYDPQAEPDEVLHQTSVPAFFLSKYELTRGQWQRAMGNDPSYDRGSLEDRPVDQVSWEDCREAMLRLGLALPTEAQWEYAARAGTETPWWCGAAKESVARAGNLADVKYAAGINRMVITEAWSDGYMGPAPVGRFDPNPFGLYDVIGNVFEWCEDHYDSYLPSPIESSTGSRDRVYRGGSFGTPAVMARSANRVHFPATSNDDDLGVRPARSISTD
jgi:formylglycine-generating enzyme required for sulfatase activity